MTCQVSSTIADIRQRVRQARQAGLTVGLVPTMGALHPGHESLIRAAKAACGFVVTSIFVNPTQFGPGEDYARYPHPTEQDLQACTRSGCDAVFMPGAEEMYGRGGLTQVTVPALSQTLCGRSRSGHFAGVCTVVAKLFNIVQPDRAFFGAKDYQQVTILRRMAADLDFPLEVVTCPTVREADGLAMSSRNAYLSPEQRTQAPALYAALCLGRDMILRSHAPARDVIGAMRGQIARQVPDGVIDYVQIVDPDTLADVDDTRRPVHLLLAVKLGPARLIDNMRVDAAGADQ